MNLQRLAKLDTLPIALRQNPLRNFAKFLKKQAHQYWKDLLIVFILAVVGGLASYFGGCFLNPVIFDHSTMDVWFGGDIPRVFVGMTQRISIRSELHPLFSTIAYPPVFFLRKLLNLDPILAVRIVIAIVASLWLSIFYILLRLIGCRHFDSFLFSALAATSASAMFWMVVSETYPFGSLSILLALCLVTLSQYQRFSASWYIFVLALTLGFTVTNGMVGTLVTAVNYRWKQSIQIIVNASFAVITIWNFHKLFFVTDTYNLNLNDEQKFIYIPKNIIELLEIWKAFLCNPIAISRIHAGDRYWLKVNERLNWPYLTTRTSGSYVISPEVVWSHISIGLWIALLILGLWGFFLTNKNTKLRIVLGFSLLGQLALHTVYGNSELFIYSMHYGPLLIVLAAFSTLTRQRRVVLFITILLIITTGINNAIHFNHAREFLLTYGP